MKNILAAMIATTMGVAGGTAWTVATHAPEATPLADSMAVTDRGSGTGDGAVEQGTFTDDSVDIVATSPTASPESGDPAQEATASESGTGSSPSPMATTTTLDALAAPATAAPASGSAEAAGQAAGAEQLARIFTAMQSRDAARVLSQLNDDEIREILTRMGARNAASILSSMDPGRAAVLSRSVLGSTGGNP